MFSWRSQIEDIVKYCIQQTLLLMGFIYGITYIFSRESAENLFPYILAQAAVAIQGQLTLLGSLFQTSRKTSINKSRKPTKSADMQWILRTEVQMLSWRSKIKDMVKYCIQQTILLMGFIYGIKYKYSRKTAENLFPYILAQAAVCVFYNIHLYFITYICIL